MISRAYNRALLARLRELLWNERGVLTDGGAGTILSSTTVGDKAGTDTITGPWGFLSAVATGGGQNLLKNYGFERWTNGTTTPDFWTRVGAASSCARDATNVKEGDFSAGLTRAGTNCYLAQRADGRRGGLPLTAFNARPVVFGGWVRATVASRARLQVNDGTTTTSSSFHTGGSAWEWLQVTAVMQAVPTVVEVRCSVETGDTTAQFDGLTFTLGTQLPDMIGTRESFQGLETGLFNHLFNGAFQIWGGAATPATLPPTGWTLTGAAATVARDGTNFRVGAYSAALTRVGADCYLEQRLDTRADVGPIARWQSRPVTYGCWVRATVATTTRLVIFDGVNTFTSGYHTGGSGWEFLTVTGVIATAADQLRVRCQVDSSNTTSQFGAAAFVLGYELGDWVPSAWTGRTSRQYVASGATFVVSTVAQYLGPGLNSATEIQVSWVVPRRCVLRRLYANASANVTTNAVIVTIRTGEATDSVVTCTVAIGARTASDLINELDVAAGTLMSIKLTTAAGSAGTVFWKISWEEEEVPE
jgi:hypothetical protein